ncbi:20667_t:CDS:1 [Dentiscutata erythropus]|uniref:20667_t:CDS:1 n=1 Tax=Dentiscutata erythropus TaxID=1348616 RepID=A0A9N9IBH3_9GLOM|nr:20667_t:CDS:1 [Dentiscutata erythropus]
MDKKVEEIKSVKFQSMISIVEKTPNTCVFINSSNDCFNQNQVINDVQKLIKLPFPPMINPCDLIVLRPDGHVPRAPNAFIIYRKLFVKAASVYSLPMSAISSIASKSWEQESDDVKEEYRRIAREAFNYRNKLCPKLKNESKRNRWKTILFNKPYTRKIRMNKPIRSVNKSTKPKKDPKSSTSKLEIGGLTETNSPNINLNLFDDWTNQDIFSIPNLSMNSNDDLHENFENHPEISSQSFNLPNASRIDNNIACDNQPFIGELGISALPEDNLIGTFDFQNMISLDHFAYRYDHKTSQERPAFADLFDSTIYQHDMSEDLLTYGMGPDYYY